MMVSCPAPAGISGDMDGLTLIGIAPPVKIASPQPGIQAGERITAIHLTDSLTVYSKNGKDAKDPVKSGVSPVVNFKNEAASFIKSLFGE